jgi:hypothetical protein
MTRRFQKVYVLVIEKGGMNLYFGEYISLIFIKMGTISPNENCYDTLFFFAKTIENQAFLNIKKPPRPPKMEAVKIPILD